MSNNELEYKNILELFANIQGEGIFVGTPSLFVRFRGCNLKCDWCDTKYSWENENSNIAQYNCTDAIIFMNNIKDYRHVVLTGGEPLLHQDELVKIIDACYDKVFTIETNGTLRPSKELEKRMSYVGFWSVSPKLDSICDLKNIIDDVEYWAKIIKTSDRKLFDELRYKQGQFKFVIRNNLDLQKLICIKEFCNDVDIIVQPDGRREDYNNACRQLAEDVIKSTCTWARVIPQIHRICWNKERGR